MGFGKTRIMVYTLAALALGIMGVLADITISDYFGFPHMAVFLIITPPLMILAVLLARRANLMYERSARMEAARTRMDELMKAAVEGKTGIPDTQEDGLATCWRELDCDKTDCPAYGVEHARCWLIARTFCRGQVQGQFANKLGDCRKCEVYKKAASDPVADIEEHFWGMMHVLREREDELEELYEESRIRNKRLNLLLSISRQALSTLDQQELFDEVFAQLTEMGTDAGAIFMIDPDGETLRPVAIHNLEPDAREGLAMKTGENVVGRAFAENTMQFSEDLPHDFRLVSPYIRDMKPQTVIAIPLLCRGRKTGVLGLWTFRPYHYDATEMQVLQIAADQLALAIDNARLFAETRRMATTDGLTGLANHRTFYQALEKETERAQRYSHPLSLLMVDVDDFKQFNDTYGHLQGDKALAEIGQIICGSVRAVDLAARYGDEEFAVVLPETSCLDSGENGCSALQVAERIRTAVATHLFEGRPGEPDVKITVSTGVSEYPTYGRNLRELVRTADDALFRAKRKGKNLIAVADADGGIRYQAGLEEKAS